jgi:hypothetical protein
MPTGGLAERQPKGTGQPATATAAVAGTAAGVGPGCSYSMDKKTCDDVEGCVWCDCSLQLPARCYDEVSRPGTPFCAPAPHLGADASHSGLGHDRVHGPGPVHVAGGGGEERGGGGGAACYGGGGGGGPPEKINKGIGER